MNYDTRPRLDTQRRMPSGPGLLTKILAGASAAVVVASAIAISVAFLAIGLALAGVLAIYVWWKTRDLRKRMRTQWDRDNNVIEGEVIRPTRDP